jgi:chaperonin cofactor prefoldin
LGALLRSPDSDLKWHYRVGEVVNALAPLEDRKHHFGENQMVALAERFHGLRSNLANLLHSTRHLVNVYDRKDLKRLQKFNWTQVARLAAIDDTRMRRDLERKCRANQWTADELRHQHLDAMGKKSSHGGSTAKRIKDTGPISTLVDTMRLTSKWLNSYRWRIQPAGSSLVRVPTKKRTTELLVLVSETLKQLTELEDAVKNSRKRLQTLKKNIEDMLSQSQRSRRRARPRR